MKILFRKYLVLFVKVIANINISIWALKRITLIEWKINVNNRFNKIFLLNKPFPYVARFNTKKIPIERLKSFYFIDDFQMMLNVAEFTQCDYFFGNIDLTLIQLLKEGGDVFVDIGANVGLYSLLSAQTFNKVVSFEPSSANFSKLNSNVKLNNYQDKISCYEVAISNTNAVKNLYNNPLNSGGSSLSSFTGSNMFDSYPEYNWDFAEVETKTLDHFLLNVKGSIDFIKIDIEGFELEAIIGAKKIIAKHNSIIYAEVSSSYLTVKKILAELPPSYIAYSALNNQELKSNSFIPQDVLFINKNIKKKMDVNAK